MMRLNCICASFFDVFVLTERFIRKWSKPLLSFQSAGTAPNSRSARFPVLTTFFVRVVFRR